MSYYTHIYFPFFFPESGRKEKHQEGEEKKKKGIKPHCINIQGWSSTFTNLKRSIQTIFFLKQDLMTIYIILLLNEETG